MIFFFFCPDPTNIKIHVGVLWPYLCPPVPLLCLPLVDGDVKPAAAVAVTPSKAKQFLASLKRPKRNLWDRSRPDVQQWIQQFMYMGFDEAVSACVSHKPVI